MGRTGSLWAYEQTPVRPDVLTTAKALGGGVPIGACVAGSGRGDVLEPGDHGSTFAGGPVATAAALAVLDAVDDPALLRRVRELGTKLRDGLAALDGVAEARGRGLMVGVGLADGIDAQALGADLLQRGLVVNVPAPATLRSAAAAPGRVLSGRESCWTDRRIASRVVAYVRRKNRPAPSQSLASSTAERIGAIVEAAERAAVSVIDDAEKQANRHLEEAQAEADRLVADRLAALAELTDSLVGQAESVRGEAELLVARLEEAKQHLAADGNLGEDGHREPAPLRGSHLSAVEPAEEPVEPEPGQPERGTPAGARLLATQMAVSGSSRTEIEARLSQRARNRGHRRDPQRDPRAGGLMHEDPTRLMAPDDRGPDGHRPHGNMRLLVACLVAVIVGLVVAVVVIAGGDGDNGTTASSTESAPTTATETTESTGTTEPTTTTDETTTESTETTTPTTEEPTTTTTTPTTPPEEGGSGGIEAP